MSDNVRHCKKCNRQLPNEYKYNECENCRGLKVKKIKKVGKITAGVAGTCFTITMAVVGAFKKK